MKLVNQEEAIAAFKTYPANSAQGHWLCACTWQALQDEYKIQKLIDALSKIAQQATDRSWPHTSLWECGSLAREALKEIGE